MVQGRQHPQPAMLPLSDAMPNKPPLNHLAMQVRETLDFAARCQGTGTKPAELRRLQELEEAAGYLPDPEIDAFMKVRTTYT